MGLPIIQLTKECVHDSVVLIPMKVIMKGLRIGKRMQWLNQHLR